MADPKVIPPAVRAQGFAQATRQNWQMLASKSVEPGERVEFDLPQVRLTSKIWVLVEATINAKHATETKFTPAPYAPYTLLRRVEVNINNGFTPFRVSGVNLAALRQLDSNSDLLYPGKTSRGVVQMGTVASTAGTPNKISLLVELPLTLNDRDAIGLIMTQNKETTVTVSMDFDTAGVLAATTSGFTFDLSTITITPMIESFTIPQNPDRVPDVSMLKLTHANRKAIEGAGEVTITLPTGLTYRRFIVQLTDANGVGLKDSDIKGNFELLMNQADRPYNINPRILAAINTQRYGHDLPDGMYVFDFTYQGNANYGGSRDYIDTERMTDFQLKFQCGKAGNADYTYEILSQLRDATSAR